jgi:transcriptional regulator with XRE-family HTH domain
MEFTPFPTPVSSSTKVELPAPDLKLVRNRAICNRPATLARCAAVPAAETIGERLRRLREERGLTQRDIAAPGVSAQYVSKVERGQRTASVKALRKLAVNLGVSWQYLETGHDLVESELRDFRLDDAELALRLGEDRDTVKSTLLELLDQSIGSADSRSAARARLTLGLLASQSSDFAGTIAQLEPVIGEPWVTPATHADSYVALGHAYAALQRSEEAKAIFRSCLEDVQRRRPVNAALVARFAIQLSCALTDAGEFEAARSAISTALRHGDSSDDPYTAMRVHWSSARLAATAGDIGAAQASINRAIGLLELTEDRANLARAHLLAAEFALWDDDLVEASEHLDVAERLLPEGCDVEDRAFLVVQQAFLAARSGEAARAMDMATGALNLLGEGVDPTVRGRAHWALGEAYAAAGADAAARAAFTEASALIPPGSKHSERLLAAWQSAVPADA